METATEPHKRTRKPTWHVTSVDAGYRRLAITMLVEAQTSIDRAAVLYQEFTDYFARFRQAVEWMYAMHNNGHECAAPFDEMCKSVDRDPDAMREKMLDKVPEVLQRLVFHGKDFTCPFCERQK